MVEGPQAPDIIGSLGRVVTPEEATSAIGMSRLTPVPSNDLIGSAIVVCPVIGLPM
jgi:hypothetical protein